ncbi:hypothetical protein G9L47_000747 [Enterococcus faecium]|nr:hypothetical protein [Enterococcus faecium]
MEIIGSVNILGVSFDGMGTIADWVNIIATVFTIIFTIRHFSKVNKVKFRIRAHSEMNDEGKKIIVFEVENLKQFSINVEFLGFSSRAIINFNHAQRIQRIAMHPSGIVLNIDLMRERVKDLDEFALEKFAGIEKIDSRDIGARVEIDAELLNQAIKVNGVSSDLYISFKESTGSFKEKKVSDLIKNM